MTPALLCFLIPLAGGCGDFVRDVPTVSQIARDQAHYSGRAVSVTARVAKLDQWTSRTGYKEQAFLICERECIHVYMDGHSPIHNGELVTVRGRYFKAYHVGRRTFYNEIEAAEVLPRE